jgi:hypothetical protein
MGGLVIKSGYIIAVVAGMVGWCWLLYEGTSLLVY